MIETEWALRPEALLQAISEWTPSLEWQSSATNARVSATWPGKRQMQVYYSCLLWGWVEWGNFRLKGKNRMGVAGRR